MLDHRQAEYWMGGRTRWPVRVQIHAASGVATATNPDTGIFGSGSTEAAAVRDLQDAMAQHLAVLDADDALTPGLVDQRDFLRRHLAA